MAPSKRRKVKPRWGEYPPVHGLDLFEFLTNDFISNIAKRLGNPKLADHSSFMHDLYGIADCYYREKLVAAGAIKPAEQKAALDHIAELSKELHWCMNNLDWSTGLSLNEKWGAYLAKRNERLKEVRGKAPFDIEPADWDLESRLRQEVIDQIQELHLAASEAAYGLPKELPKKPRGRKTNEALHNFVWQLWQLYEEHTGGELRLTYDPINETYKGPFFDLSRAFLDAIDADNGISDNALGDTIRRALGKRH